MPRKRGMVRHSVPLRELDHFPTQVTGAKFPLPS